MGHSIFLACSLLLVSCSDELRELPQLDVEILKDHFPYSQFANADKIVFANVNNTDRVFTIEHQSMTDTITDQDISYKRDLEKFIISPDNASNFFPTATRFIIELTSTYIDEKPVQEIIISQEVEDETLFILKLDALGMPDNGSVGAIQILAKFYEDVFTSNSVFSNTINAGFYFNKKYGILGYVDEFGHQQTFDRFE